MLTDTFRLEIEAFNIKVIELKTGLVRTNFSNNVNSDQKPGLRKGSIYEPARNRMDEILRSEAFNGQGMDVHTYAKLVAGDILKKHPPLQIYRGDSAWYARIIPMLPFGMLNGTLKKVLGLDVVEQMLRKDKRV